MIGVIMAPRNGGLPERYASLAPPESRSVIRATSMNPKALLCAFALYCLLAFIGCSDHGLDSNAIQLQNAVWILQSFETVGGTTDAISDGRIYSIAFLSDSIAQVRADCNNCTAIYHAHPANTISQISVGNLLCTEIYCGPQSRDSQFLNALRAASSYTIHGNMLRVLYNQGQQVSNFMSSL
jgi:heat shock protein HslJ